MTSSVSKTWWLREFITKHDLKTVSEVADILGVSQATLRRLTDSDAVKAPSQEYRVGKWWVYLYTEEDVQELKEHFQQRVQSRNSL